MALPPSTANWHWKNKNVSKWGHEWFKKELKDLAVTGDNEGEIATISSVDEVEGDMELGQRKSKLITIYDCNVHLIWEGTAKDGTQVTGKLNIPEVSHEITLDGLSDYQYIWSITSTESSPAVDALFSIVKSRFPKVLEPVFARLPVDLIETHGKDLTISADPSRAGTPAPTAPSAATPASSAPAPEPAPKKPVEKKSLNTSKVVVDANFMVSASDLFSLLTDEKRIPSWTRSAAQSTGQVDSEYSLFGGGVKGKYVSVTPHTEIVQTWALQSPTWPAGHIGTLTTTLDQSSDSTKITLTLAGVPTGMEDEIKRNLEGYYIHGLKSIGLGSSL
ncbi:activator of Hsp90 ATPase [Mycena floridula]|nr:activator of Hsp90 ATPase [Mycena floridula]